VFQRYCCFESQIVEGKRANNNCPSVSVAEDSSICRQRTSMPLYRCRYCYWAAFARMHRWIHSRFIRTPAPRIITC
jgi:hypothetical protein